MARVSEAFFSSFPAMKEVELKQPILFVVDMINGFIKQGALHDEAIMEIVEPITTLLKQKNQRTIFVADAHPENAREFISYPSHCILDSYESEIINELKGYVQELFHKNSTNTFTSKDFQSFLNAEIEGYHDIIVTGCCSDICIMQFALCLNSWCNEHDKKNMRLIIPITCIDTYHIKGVHDAAAMNEFSIRNMEANGITIVTGIERG